MKMRLRLAMMATLVCAMAGCAGTSPPNPSTSSLLSGNLFEAASPNGCILRLTAEELESWKRYDRNPRKGNGDSCILKAEISF